MKEINIKGIVFILITTLGLASCLKKEDMNIDPEKTTGTVMELQFLQEGGTTINSGMQYFSGGALTYPGTDVADTATYNISLAGPVTLSSDLTVTIDVDATKVLDNYKSDSIKYELMPDSLYDLVATTATIPAGKRVVQMQVIFYPSKIDISKSYMLPVVIKDAPGQTISSNFSTIYFHVIGNPLAGNYIMTGNRYNFVGSVAWSGPPNIPAGNTGITVYDDVVVAAPVNAQTISLTFGNVPNVAPVTGTSVYLITGNSTFSAITYTFEKSFLEGYSNVIKYVVSYTPPSATEKASFHLMTKYNNAQGNGGNDRLIDQTFTHE